VASRCAAPAPSPCASSPGDVQRGSIDEHRGHGGGAHRLCLLLLYPGLYTSYRQSKKGEKMQDGRQAKGVQNVTIHCYVTRLIFKL
jgi:hypothetical protein